MTWKPSFNLNIAVALTNQLDGEAANFGLEFTDTFKWRLVQVIQDALDSTESHATAAAQLTNLPSTATNYDPSQETMTFSTQVMDAGEAAGFPSPFVMPLPYKDESGAVVQPDPAEMAQQMLTTSDPATVKFLSETAHQLVKDQQATKRGRGRPKGAKGKKRKAKATKPVVSNAATGANDYDDPVQ